jgi:hypothetical protein
MRLIRRLLALLAGALLLASQEAQAAVPLGTIALRVTNLRPGYTVASSGYMTAAAIAQQYGITVNQLSYYGWANSFDALFVRRDAAGLGEVGNKIDHYASPVGAHWGYRVAVQNTLCCGKYRTRSMPGIGNESTGFIATSGARGFIGIKFREGSYVVGVSVLPGTKEASLLLLARLVDQRVRLYG